MTNPEGYEGTDTPVPEQRDGFLEQQHLLSKISLMLDEYFATRHVRRTEDPVTDQEVTGKKEHQHG